MNLKKEYNMKITKKSISRLGAIAVATAIVFACPLIASKGPKVTVPFSAGIASVFALFCFVLWYMDVRHNVGKSSATGKPKNQSDFDWGMHYFRAFAILAIMACHYASAFRYLIVNNVFFTTSTIYFLFISGYLCQFLDDKRRVSPGTYYKKKLLNVICPFVIFSVLFGILKGAASPDFTFIQSILLGRVQGQYWYIPFVSLLFLVSPFICRMKNRSLLTLLVVTGGLFTLFPRRPGVFTFHWPEIFNMYAFFTVWYVMGFVYCRSKERIDVVLRDYRWWFLTGAALMCILIWSPSWFPLSCSVPSIGICMQRFLTMCCVLVMLQKLKDRRIWLFDQIAKLSFTLYFIHFAFYIQLAGIRSLLLGYLAFLPTCFAECFVYAVYVALMLVVSLIFKTAFGKSSRSLIGA